MTLPYRFRLASRQPQPDKAATPAATPAPPKDPAKEQEEFLLCVLQYPEYFDGDRDHITTNANIDLVGQYLADHFSGDFAPELFHAAVKWLQVQNKLRPIGVSTQAPIQAPIQAQAAQAAPTKPALPKQYQASEIKVPRKLPTGEYELPLTSTTPAMLRAASREAVLDWKERRIKARLD
jgi:hypothetical protein